MCDMYQINVTKRNSEVQKLKQKNSLGVCGLWNICKLYVSL